MQFCAGAWLRQRRAIGHQMPFRPVEHALELKLINTRLLKNLFRDFIEMMRPVHGDIRFIRQHGTTKRPI
jgi:hypothetical protein